MLVHMTVPHVDVCEHSDITIYRVFIICLFAYAGASPITLIYGLLSFSKSRMPRVLGRLTQNLNVTKNVTKYN